MADDSRRDRNQPSRPLIDWEEAFRFYASLPVDRRSYRAVADQFGVSIRTVEKHGRSGRWRERVERIQQQASAHADEQLARAWAERLADIEQLLDASFVVYAQRLRGGSARVTASDFVGLVKLALQLRGEPTDRVELLASSTEWVALRARILDAVATLPEAGAAIAAILEEGDG
jgi:hypothetical protein